MSIETKWALRVFRTVDQWYVRVQNLAKAAGFLGSGRETVRDVSDPGGRHVEFPDLSDEGWPAFRFPVPREAEFSHTVSGIFYRGVVYLCPMPPEELAPRYKAALAETGIAFEAREDKLNEFVRTFDYGGDVRLGIGAWRQGRTPVRIGQYRHDNAVEETIRRRNRTD